VESRRSNNDRGISVPNFWPQQHPARRHERDHADQQRQQVLLDELMVLLARL
jgi:hypothetical protein